MGQSQGFEVTVGLQNGDRGDATSDLGGFVQGVLDAMPFTAYVGATVRSVEPGRAEILLPADERFTNHIGTVHAIAELVPAETCGGVAITSELSDLLQEGYVPIAKSLRVDWVAPARGELTATATLPEELAQHMRAAARAGERVACTLDIPVTDASGTVVAEVSIDYVLKQLG